MIGNWQSWLHGPAQEIGWLLAQSVWIGAAAAGGCGFLLLMTRHATPRLRYLLCCAALATVVIGLMVAWCLEQGSLQPRAEIVAPIRVALVGATPGYISENQPLPWLGYAASAWIAAVFLLGLWQLAGWLNLLRWRRNASELDADWHTRLERLAPSVGVRRAVKVRASGHVCTPAVVGALRPMILIPFSLATGLTPAQVSAILAHELAHIRRHDYLVNLLQGAIETLFFYHPAVWWISRRIRQEREHCCDDIAAAVTNDRVEYARTLLALEELRHATLAPAMAGGDLRRRVARLLKVEAASGRRSAWPVVAILALMGALLPLRTGHADDAAPTTRPANTATTKPTAEVDVVVALTSIKVDGQDSDWDTLRKTLQAIPADQRKNTKLCLSAATDDLPVGVFFEVQGRADALVQEMGLAYLSITGVDKSGPGNAVGEYYIIGVARTGVYSLSGRQITLMDALVAAGGWDKTIPNPMVVLYRRTPTGEDTFDGIPMDDLWSGKAKDHFLLPYDIVAVRPGH